MSETEPTIILTDAPRAPRAKPDTRCPRCRAGEDQRVASAGFGLPHDVCQRCGYEWSREASIRCA